MSAEQTETLLSTEVCRDIDKWVAKYPPERKQSALIAALRITQEANGGWLSESLIQAVADYLQLPHIAAFEVATFYSMFDLQPIGRHKICVCTNIACMLCGSDKIVAHLKDKLKIGFNETTTDAKFTLKEVECLAACGGAPAMQIGKRYYEHLTPEKLDKILDELE